MIIKILLTVIVLLVIPCILGINYEKSFNGIGDSNTICITRSIVMGFATMLALFHLVAVPMIYIGTTFHALLLTWSFFLIIFIVISIWNNRNYIRIDISSRFSFLKEYFTDCDKETLIIWFAFFFLVLFETSLMIFRTHMDADDGRFIAEAMEAYEKNSLLRIHPITGESLNFPIGEMIKELTSPYPIFIAAISTIICVHPAVMAHAILPVFLIPLSYVVAFFIADLLFKNKKKVPVFLFILASIILFSFESMYSWGYTLLAIIWQGRSIMAVIFIPFLWYLFLIFMRSDYFPKGMYFALSVVSLACIDLSGMGGIIVPILGAAFALSFFVVKRRIMPTILIGLCTFPVGVFVVIYKLL